jgi:hypothetical protein
MKQGDGLRGGADRGRDAPEVLEVGSALLVDLAVVDAFRDALEPGDPILVHVLSIAWLRCSARVIPVHLSHTDDVSAFNTRPELWVF